ncbi:MAG: sulfurtransferase TusA family protein [Candidatus Omnitrophota bacterium]|jgi:tRNA 2-thiouridine synthesizing protein A
MTEIKVDDRLDLKGVVCPINFVKTKLKLEEMQDGQVLEVIIDDGEPMQNVPRSIKEEGHKIIKVEKLSGNSFRLLIKKGGGNLAR